VQPNVPELAYLGNRGDTWRRSAFGCRIDIRRIEWSLSWFLPWLRCSVPRLEERDREYFSCSAWRMFCVLSKLALSFNASIACWMC